MGLAWESGLLAGLAERGADVSGADFLLGTSAGSVVGALLALGHSPAALVEPLLKDPSAASEGTSAGQAPSTPSSERPSDLSDSDEGMPQVIAPCRRRRSTRAAGASPNAALPP